MKKLMLLGALTLLIPACASKSTSQAQGGKGFKICSGTLTASKVGTGTKRNIVKGCVADDGGEDVQLKVVEKGEDGKEHTVPIKFTGKTTEGNTLVYNATSEDGVRKYRLRLTPEERIRTEGSMNDFFEGSLEISGEGIPTQQLNGLHFYTENPSQDLHWSYQGDSAPQRWGKLKSDFEACESGKRQSPLDIGSKAAKPSSLGKIKFYYKPSQLSLVNNGHALQANVESGNYIEIKGQRYDLMQFHAHVPSEHLIDGKESDIELHFVHQAADKSLAVIGVLAKASKKAKPSDLLTAILKEFPTKVNDPREFSQKLSPEKLLPPRRGYFSYPGSLTTPPCAETVTWFVLSEVIPIQSAHLADVKRLVGGVNARRPTPALGERTVVREKN